MSQGHLERMLGELASEIEYPPTPPLAAAVAARLRLAPAPRPQVRPAWLRPVIAVAAVLVALGLSLAFSPTVRRAAADLLGIAGIHISVGDGTSTNGSFERSDLPGPGLLNLDLGERLPVERAEKVVGFDVRGTHALLGPSYTYLDPSIGDSGMVSTVFYSLQAPRRAAYLVTEFRASVDEAFFKKVSQTQGGVRFVQVGVTTGFWVSRAPHLFWYVDEEGDLREESIRLAGNVLLWEQDGITYRIEGADSLDEAQRIAGALF